MLHALSVSTSPAATLAAAGNALLAPASAAAVAMLVLAAASDAERRSVPNRYAIVLAACGLLALPALPGREALAAFLLALAVLVAGVFAFARGWVGGADVKLLAGAMLWTGSRHLALFAVAMALASIAVAAALGLSRAAAARSGGVVDRRAPSLPLAVPIAAGGILAILDRLALLPAGGA